MARSGTRGAYLLPAIAGAGIALRLAIVAATPSWSLTDDGARFAALAKLGMAGTAFVPPLYVGFLAAVRRVAGEGVAPVRIAQSLLGGITILLTGILAGRLARPEMARRASALAALLAAFAPPLLLADLTVMSESLAALLTAAYLVASGGAHRSGWRAAGAGGIFLGLGALCRSPIFAYTLIRGAVLSVVERGGRPARAAALATTVVALLVVAPWAARIARLFGRFVPVSTNGGYNFWKSFHPASTGTESGYDHSLFKPLDERDMDAVGYREGMKFIRERPERAVGLAFLKEGHLWGLERTFFIGWRNGTWGPLPFAVAALLVLAIPATQIFWVFFAPWGLARAPSSPTRREGLLLLGFTCALHVVFNAEARYHVPLLPLLLAAASAGAVQRIGLQARAPDAGREHGRGTEGWSERLATILPWAISTPVVAFWACEVLVERAEIARLLGG